VTSKTHPLVRSVVKPLRLGELANTLAGDPDVGTLYIPALSSRPIADVALMEFMTTAGMDAPSPS
jgi:hypothetical protein